MSADREAAPLWRELLGEEAVAERSALVPATFATSGDKAPRQQSAIVGFERPTWVAGEMLIGTYVIVHDEDKMARGEPCTALYRVGLRNRPREEVVSFHCIPHERKVVLSFTMSVSSISSQFKSLTQAGRSGKSEPCAEAAVERRATLGEIVARLRGVFGAYVEKPVF